jgi:hypothetical protein
VFFALLAITVAASYYPPVQRAYQESPWTVSLVVGLLSIPVWLIVDLWPWRPADVPEPEVSVERRHDLADLTQPALTVAVPNVPLGLSGLIFYRGGDPASASASFVGLDPTIDRTFLADEPLFVSAVVNDGQGDIRSQLTLLDAAGRTIHTTDMQITKNALQQRIQSWDDVADDDPATHFARLDAKLDLAGLASGPYRIVLTVQDATGTSERDDTIRVVAERGSGRV